MWCRGHGVLRQPGGWRTGDAVVEGRLLRAVNLAQERGGDPVAGVLRGRGGERTPVGAATGCFIAAQEGPTLGEAALLSRTLSAFPRFLFGAGLTHAGPTERYTGASTTRTQAEGRVLQTRGIEIAC